MSNVVALGAFAHFQPSECEAMDWEDFVDYVDIVAKEVDKQNKAQG